MLITNEGRIFHGTTRSHDGRWRIEEIDAEAFARWLTKKKEPQGTQDCEKIEKKGG